MPSKTIYKQRQGISSRKLGPELMLYDQHNDKVHVLNETGSLIWGFVDGKKSLPEINNIFAEQFPDSPREQLNRDIQEIIRKLAQEKLIVLAN